MIIFEGTAVLILATCAFVDREAHKKHISFLLEM